MSFVPEEDELTLRAALAFVDEFNQEESNDVDHQSNNITQVPKLQLNRRTDDEADNNSTDGISVVDTSASAVSKRARKRHRDEIVYLRCRVQQLEDRLGRLQQLSRSKGNNQNPQRLALSSTIASTYDVEIASSASSSSEQSSSPFADVWEKVATRQFHQRQQAELENAQLREMLEEQIRLARSLERVLKRRTNSDALKPKHSTKNFKWHRFATKEEEATIFRSLLDELEPQYQESSRIFTPEQFPSAIFRTITVRTTGDDDDTVANDGDSDEMYVQVLDSKILPFDLRSTAATFWQYLTKQHLSTALSCTPVECTNDTIARSFGVEINVSSLRGEFRGKQCVRRYEEESRTVIVWNMLIEPIEIAGECMYGLLTRQKAWFELTPCEEDPVNATQMRAQIVLTPDVYDDDDPEQGRKVGAITDFVLQSAHANLNASYQMIENMLLQSKVSVGSIID